jgi:sugar phosphate isomerase/epimerase
LLLSIKGVHWENEEENMKISCCWLYAISRYGYPPSLRDTFKALREMKEMGFEAGELEGVRETNLREVYRARRDIKVLCSDIGLEIINFCPVLPDIVSMDARRRRHAVSLFEMGVELACFFGSRQIQIDSFTPPLVFRGVAPYKKAVRFN